MNMKMFLLSSIGLILLSCVKEKEVNENISRIPVSFTINRFDKAFYETPTQDFGKLKATYPYFFPQNAPDSVWTNKAQNPLYRELYQEVQNQFSDINPLQEELKSLFQHVIYYFPNMKVPKVTTLISEMDYTSKAIYTDSLVIISLDLYLGKNHKFYEFPAYIKQNFEPNQIVQDLVTDLYERKAKPITDKSFVSQMVYQGKCMYLKETLISLSTDAEVMGFTADQIAWATENESYVWRYFIERKVLYDTDATLVKRFIVPAPFSKFYLDLDNESPGRIGAWIGWQIVRSYMQNNDVTLVQMLAMDEKELFLKSKYKPSK